MDELYGFFIFEQDLADAFSAIHPSQLLFSTADPGVSGRIGWLKQNAVAAENYIAADPASDTFKVVS